MRIVSGVLDRLVLACCLAIGLAMLQPADGFASSARVQAAYDAVLASPDDLQKNVDLLEAQLAEGDFEAASVTLQRILLQNPNFDEARLVRAAVFLRLGDDAGAASDLAYLENRPLSPEDRAEADRLAAEVRADPSAATLDGVIRFGAVYDSNPGQRPGTFTLGGQNFAFPAEGAFGGFGELQFIGELPLGGEGHSLRVEGHGFARGHFDDSRGHSYARLAAGPRIDLGFAFLDLMALAQAEFVGGHFYGSRLGGRAQLIIDVSDRVSASVRVEAAHDRADVNLFSTTNVGDGDGWEFSAAPSMTYRISNSWDVTTHAHYATKDAGSAWFSYDAYGGGLSVRYRNASGYQVRLGGSVRDVSYDAINPNVIPATVARDERRYALDVAVAAPFNLIFDHLGVDGDRRWASGWSLETFGRYEINDSNIPVYDSDNWTVGLSVARRFSL
jgi:hypothetical protein